MLKLMSLNRSPYFNLHFVGQGDCSLLIGWHSNLFHFSFRSPFCQFLEVYNIILLKFFQIKMNVDETKNFQWFLLWHSPSPIEHFFWHNSWNFFRTKFIKLCGLFGKLYFFRILFIIKRMSIIVWSRYSYIMLSTPKSY